MIVNERPIENTAEFIAYARVRSGHLCDAVIVANDAKFPVHRAIMAANSPYFRALFTNGMRESDEREVHIVKA
jgi:hypothetical protein